MFKSIIETVKTMTVGEVIGVSVVIMVISVIFYTMGNV